MTTYLSINILARISNAHNVYKKQVMCMYEKKRNFLIIVSFLLLQLHYNVIIISQHHLLYTPHLK